MPGTSEHRFLPRYRGFAFGAIAFGAALIVFGLSSMAHSSRAFALIGGAIGMALGTLYLTSPTWRLYVVLDDDGLEVCNRRERKFRVAWSEVVRVVASPATHTCFVDAGDPARNLLVPGAGAPAPYRIARQDALYDAIVDRLSDRIIEVESLRDFDREQAKAP